MSLIAYLQVAGADPGFLKRGGGASIGLQAKKGDSGGGPILGPMLKSLHRGPKGGSSPPDPDPPMGSSHILQTLGGSRMYIDWGVQCAMGFRLDLHTDGRPTAMPGVYTSNGNKTLP